MWALAKILLFATIAKCSLLSVTIAKSDLPCPVLKISWDTSFPFHRGLPAATASFIRVRSAEESVIFRNIELYTGQSIIAFKRTERLYGPLELELLNDSWIVLCRGKVEVPNYSGCDENLTSNRDIYRVLLE